MIRTVLLAVEILLAVGALGAGTVAIVQGRDALTAGEGLTVAKRQVLVDAGLAGLVLAVMVVAAWAVYAEQHWARSISIVAGAVLVAATVIRSGSAGRQSVNSLIALLGVLVAVLGFLLPGGA